MLFFGKNGVRMSFAIVSQALLILYFELLERIGILSSFLFTEKKDYNYSLNSYLFGFKTL